MAENNYTIMLVAGKMQGDPGQGRELLETDLRIAVVDSITGVVVKEYGQSYYEDNANGRGIGMLPAPVLSGEERAAIAQSQGADWAVRFFREQFGEYMQQMAAEDPAVAQALAKGIEHVTLEDAATFRPFLGFSVAEIEASLGRCILLGYSPKMEPGEDAKDFAGPKLTEFTETGYSEQGPSYALGGHTMVALGQIRKSELARVEEAFAQMSDTSQVFYDEQPGQDARVHHSISWGLALTQSLERLALLEQGTAQTVVSHIFGEGVTVEQVRHTDESAAMSRFEHGCRKLRGERRQIAQELADETPNEVSFNRVSMGILLAEAIEHHNPDAKPLALIVGDPRRSFDATMAWQALNEAEVVLADRAQERVV
ncbi:MAG: hypothetical protein J0L97_09960 [Alphaproteobacteria bacterium]|nr:hypothetical protein [Alphaproteobacteria bacterium]